MAEIELRPGDIAVVSFPFTDLRAAKLRPAVVLAVLGEDIVVVGIFSKVPTTLQDFWLVISEGDAAFRPAGLKKSSVIKGEKVAVLHRSIIQRKIGALPLDVFTQVKAAVKKALGLA